MLAVPTCVQAATRTAAAPSKRPRLLAWLLMAALAPAHATAPVPSVAPACRSGTVYLTFDTGSQSQADFIAATLNKYQVKATFFLANEKTVRGDWTLDPSWAPYWKARVAEGHAFGTHTFDHVYWQRDGAGGKVVVKPQFGAQAGHTLTWTSDQYCAELKRVEQRFNALTGSHLDPFWRAPGGHTSPNTLAAATACGYEHAGWATPAGYSGDETSSKAYPNPLLLKRALDGLKDGDIFMAHLGIWSRQDPWAPAVLDPLIAGLKQKGVCFATLRDHPQFAHKR
jgi:peptidoglycan/xylan/chitin deacetylase (PgdA/CDA1 family)